MTSSGSAPSPRNVRQGLSHYEPGAHLWAPFAVHLRGGVASLLAFAILYFTGQPLHDAMALLTIGGYTAIPLLAAGYATLWAYMSIAILGRLKFRDSLRVHLVWYAGVGAVALLFFAMLSITIVQGWQTGFYDPSTSSSFFNMLLGAPILGALGAAFGRWAIDKGIYWHRWIERGPLPDVFKFVEGKRDKDDFKRL